MTTDKGLMVWLPLTDANHCENLGLVGKLTCITTPTFVDGGKLGKCLSTGEYLMSAALTTKVFNNNHLTIAFWVYIDAATGASTPRSAFIGNTGMSANNNRKFMIMLYPTVNDLHYSWMNDDAAFIALVFLGVLPSYKWTHVAMTYENPTIITYINGVEVGRNFAISNSSTFAYTTPIIKNNTGRRINDFRVYSYALSPQEIKELSRGKIGHWLGNDPWISKNIFTPNWKGEKILNLINRRNLTLSLGRLDGSAAGKYLTVSFDFKFKDCTFNDNNAFYMQCDSSNRWYYQYLTEQISKENSDWKHIVNTVNLTSSAGTGACYPYFRCDYISGTAKIRNLKMELGLVASTYTSPSHPVFLSDISGFGRHGQVVGNVTLAEDTPRYDKSLKYNGGNVVVTGLPTMSTYTISWWDKFPANTGLLFDWRLGPVDTTMDLSSAGVLINNNTCYFKIGGVTTDYLNYSNYDITANTWCHCCLVCDDSKSRLYINGILKWEANKGSMADFSLLILGGRNAAANDGYLYTGQHSDFRIYATALSADDVKELYSLGH